MVFDIDGSLAATIDSVQGVKQGDPVSSLLFALTIQSAFAAAVVGLPNVTAVAYLDDLQIIGDPKSVLQAYDRLLDSLPHIGLTINPSKSACLWPSVDQEPPPSLSVDLGIRNIPLRTGFMEIMGGPVGFDELAIERWCFEQVRAHDSFFHLLRHPLLSSHHALLLLKSSLRPRLNYVMRCTPPSLLAPALAEFDASCLQLMQTKIAPQLLRPTLSEFARQQMSLPAADGGLGLQCLATTSMAAFIASVAPAIQDVQGLLPAENFEFDARNTPATFRHLISSSTSLRARGVQLELPQDIPSIRSSFDAGAPLHFQSKIMQSFHDSLRRHMLRDSAYSDAEKARLVAAGGQHASMWLHLGSLAAPPLSDGAIAAAICHRLGIGSVPLPARNCACGVSLTATHLHACPRNKRRGILNRHDKIKLKLAYIARTAGLDVEVEPSSWVADHHRPDAEGTTRVTDLRLRGLGRPAHVDVAVLCSSAPSHCTRVAKSRSCVPVLRSRQSQKSSYYRELVEREGATFHAFVLDSCGGFSEPAMDLLRSIATHAAEHHPLFDFFTFLDWAIALVAGALQEGNRAVDVRGASIQH